MKTINRYICVMVLLFNMVGYAQYGEGTGTQPTGYGPTFTFTGVNPLLEVTITAPSSSQSNWSAQIAAQNAATQASIQAQIPKQQPVLVQGPTPTPTITPVKPDCVQAKNNDARANNSTISGQNSSIRKLSTSREFGAEQNLTTFPVGSSLDYNNVSVRSGATSSFAPNITWNSTDGYTIGISHGHPGNGAPSPADLVNAYTYLSNPELVAAGQTAIDYFKANFTITIVTQNETYTVNITDWEALGKLYNAYKADTKAGDDAYKAKGQEYVDNIDDQASYADITTYAALSLYGSAVNITKTDKGSTVSSPVKIGTTKKVVKKPCTP